MPSPAADLTRTFLRSNPLYLVTDTSIARLSHIQIVRLAVRSGIRIVQLRDKGLPRREIYEAAMRIREITLEHDAVFIVNDHVDIALASDADGVHLGQGDMPVKDARRLMGKRKVIGVSTHSLRQALLAQQSGADYIGFGPMFKTRTKDAGYPRGIRALNRIRTYVSIPIVAIGGITWENVHKVLEAGADAAATASGVLSGDIKANVTKFMEAAAR